MEIGSIVLIVFNSIAFSDNIVWVFISYLELF